MSEKLLEQLITTETEYFKWETKLDRVTTESFVKIDRLYAMHHMHWFFNMGFNYL